MKNYLIVILFFYASFCVPFSVNAQPPDCSPITVISTNITTNTTLSASVLYRIQGCVRVSSGVTLTIPAGTTITFADNDLLVVEEGASILATGTSGSPIVFTSAAAPGSRVPLTNAGVVIAGDAEVNESVLGLPCSYNLTTGANNADNSGTLSYVQFHYLSGSSLGAPLDNALTLAGVGSGTTLDHIEISHSGANGLGILGGQPTINNLFVLNTAINDIYITLGAQTLLEEVLTLHKDCSLKTAAGTNGLWVENNRSNTTATPLTLATVDKSTFMGPLYCGCSPDADFKDGISLHFNAGLDLKNSVVTGYNGYGLYIDDQESANNTDNGRVKVNYTSFNDNGTNDYNHNPLITWLGNACDLDMQKWIEGTGSGTCVQFSNQFSSFVLDYDTSICGDYCTTVPAFTLGNNSFIDFIDGSVSIRRGSVQPTDLYPHIEACPLNAVYCTPVPLLRVTTPSSSLKVSPNPATQLAQIGFVSERAGIAEVVVREMVTGRILYKGTLKMREGGLQSLQIPVFGWKEGIYPVQIKTGEQLLQSKISVK